jgi:hypothetical protein
MVYPHHRDPDPKYYIGSKEATTIMTSQPQKTSISKLLKSGKKEDAQRLADLLFKAIRFEDEEDYGYSLSDLSENQLKALGRVLKNTKFDYTTESNGSYWSSVDGYVPAPAKQ